jgi:hypothetical protein
MAGNRVVLTFIGEDKQLRKTIKDVEGKLGDIAGATAKWGSIIGAVSAVAAPAAIAGVALGFAGLGVAIAAQNEKVKASFTGLKDHVVASVTKMAEPFVPVLLQVSKLARTTFDQLRPALTQAFALSAPFVTTLSQGLAGLVNGIMPGFVAILRSAQPVVAALSDGLAGMGVGLGQMFTAISTAANPAAQVLSSLLGVVNGLLPILGRLIASAATGLAPVFKYLGPLVLSVADALGTVLGAAFEQLGPPLGRLIMKLTPIINYLLPQISGVLTGVVIPALGSFINWLADSVDQIELFAADSVVAFLEAGRVVLGFASTALGAMSRVFAALSMLGGAFGERMGQAARATAGAKVSVDNLRGTVDQLHGKAVDVRAQIFGRQEAERLAGVVNWFPAVRNVRINFSTNFGAIGGPSLVAAAHGRAVGGTVNKGSTYLVGERGPEYLTMPSSGTVTPNHKIGSGGGRSGGAAQITFGGNVDSAFATAFMKLVRSGQIQIG